MTDHNTPEEVVSAINSQKIRRLIDPTSEMSLVLDNAASIIAKLQAERDQAEALAVKYLREKSALDVIINRTGSLLMRRTSLPPIEEVQTGLESRAYGLLKEFVERAQLETGDFQPMVIAGVAIKGDRSVVVGVPAHYHHLPEDHELQHNCDEMGCTSVEHVLWRGSYQDESEPEPPPPPKDDRLERIKTRCAFAEWLLDQAAQMLEEAKSKSDVEVIAEWFSDEIKRHKDKYARRDDEPSGDQP